MSPRSENDGVQHPASCERNDMINAKVIRNEKCNAHTIMHAAGDPKTLGELEAEGRAFACDHRLGNCIIAAHQDSIHGDHVHVVVKE